MAEYRSVSVSISRDAKAKLKAWPGSFQFEQSIEVFVMSVAMGRAVSIALL